MSRKHFVMSTLSLAVALSLAGPDAIALGVGGLRVQSALNQPFVGEIDLLDVKPDELDSVKAQIAGAEEFGKAGAERYHYLTKVRFSPQISPRGKAVLRVSSREPIREPYMDFLVEVQWPKGRVVKEYTVLLDPAVTAERSSPRIEQPVSRARSAPSETEAPPRPIEQRVERPRKAAAAPPPDPGPRAVPVGVATDGFPKYVGPVRSGTGLWRLAARNAPQGATVAQTAMALYRNNQGAFSRGNINRLSAGKTLVIPSADELFALDPAEAQREFQAALRGDNVRRAPIVPGSTPGTPDGQSRLKIAGTAPPGDKTGTGAAAAPGSEGMEQELLLVREASESTRQETVEMRGRIRDLEAQLSEIQKLLQLRNAELARIQKGTSEQAQVAAVDPATPPDAVQAPGAVSPEGPAQTGAEAASPSEPLPGTLPLEGSAPAGEGAPGGPTVAGAGPGAGAPDGIAAVPEPLSAATGPSAEGSVAPSTAQTTVSTQAPPLVGETQTATAPTTQPEAAPLPGVASRTPDDATGDSTWHALLLPLAGIAGVTALGIGALTWWRSRGRRREEDFAADLDSAESFEALGPAASSAAGAGIAQKAKGSAFADSADTGGSETPSSAMPSSRRAERETDETDFISEADIYIAYGRFREAEELLRDEIRRSPNRLDIKLKLADAYLGSKNRSALEALIQEMKSPGAPRVPADQLQRLTEMAESIRSDDDASDDFGPAGGSAAVGGGRPDSAGRGPIPDNLDAVSKEVFSLDISDMQRPVAERLGLSRGRDSSPFSAEPRSLERGLERASRAPAAAERRAVGSAPDLADPLVMDEEEFSRRLGLDDDSDDLSEDLSLLPPSSAGRASYDRSSRDSSRDSPDGVSDLELNIDELWAASDVDLESFVDATQTGAKGSEPALGSFDPQLGLSPPTPLRPVSSETVWGPRPSAMTGLFGGQEESASSDLLTSQWQMDSGLWDETATKLDLARAYIEMGDKESARGILEEVVGEGTEEQRAEAGELLRRVG